MLAEALAHHFEAKLLLLDVADFSLKMQSKYGGSKKDLSFHRSISEMTLERMSNFFGSLSGLPSRDDNRGTVWTQNSGLDAAVRNTQGDNDSLKHRRTSSVSSDMSNIGAHSSFSNTAPSKHVNRWSFDERVFLQSLSKFYCSTLTSLLSVGHLWISPHLNTTRGSEPTIVPKGLPEGEEMLLL